ncbi:MAG: MlrC C-terminal domain-containing protein, partial [Acidobacteriota bacterium]
MGPGRWASRRAAEVSRKKRWRVIGTIRSPKCERVMTAVVAAGNITVVIISQAVNLFDRSLFLAHGLDPAYFDGTVVK